MIKVLYFGNRLVERGYSPTSIDTLGHQLTELFEVKRFSDRKNQLLRLINMVNGLYGNRNWADCVLIDTYSSTAFYFAFIIGFLSKKFDIKYIPILHGGNLEYRLKNHPKKSKYFFGNAYKLVAPSGFMKSLFEKYGFENIKLIPNNIELKQYLFKQRDNIQPKILWVRSFAELYNPILAIKLVERLKNKYPEVKLCFVGPEKDGTMARCKLMTKELCLEKQVDFKGKLSKEDWINLSSDYDIFLSTTNIDNTPVSVMEAMALGMIVVSTNVGGVPYIVDDGKTGYLYGPNDLEGLNKLIEQCLSGSNSTVSQNARKKAEEWDWQVVKIKWSII